MRSQSQYNWLISINNEQPARAWVPQVTMTKKSRESHCISVSDRMVNLEKIRLTFNRNITSENGGNLPALN